MCERCGVALDRMPDDVRAELAYSIIDGALFTPVGLSLRAVCERFPQVSQTTVSTSSIGELREVGMRGIVAMMTAYDEWQVGEAETSTFAEAIAVKEAWCATQSSAALQALLLDICVLAELGRLADVMGRVIQKAAMNSHALMLAPSRDGWRPQMSVTAHQVPERPAGDATFRIARVLEAHRIVNEAHRPTDDATGGAT